MRTEPETTRIVRSWLRTDEHESADRVLDNVLALLDTTPQRRSWWPARRIEHMNGFAKLLIAAAAVVVVAVVGVNLVPGANPGVGAPSTTPTPAVSPSPPVSPLPAEELPVTGTGRTRALEPGRYAWTWPGGRLTFELPAGFSVRADGYIFKNGNQPTETGFSAWLPGTPYEVTHVYADACRSAGRLEPVGPTVDDLIDALDRQTATQIRVTDVTIGRYAGRRVEVEEDTDVDRSTCRHGAAGPLQVWADTAERTFFAAGPGDSGVVWVADVNGDRIVVTSGYPTVRAPAALGELNAIVDSISFE